MLEVYYFSGTGNCLAAARDIAGKANGALVSIPSVMDRQSIKTADAIGIVFPCYLASLFGVPLIVERFVKKIEDIGAKYIFAVCTFGGHENVNGLPALKNLERMINSAGGLLSAEFSIQLPMNNLDYGHVPFPQRNHNIMFKRCTDKIDSICKCVADRKTYKYKASSVLLNWLMTPLYTALGKLSLSALKKYSKEPADSKLKYCELIPLTDKSIDFTSEKCTGCGTCEKVCPAGNIKMLDKKPVWQHRCEMCFACDEWCPAKAIHHWGKTRGKDYHHPGVKVSDMVRQKHNG